MDQTWLDWNYALYAGKEPNVTGPGLEYMLQGGSDASNTDPLATEPAEGEDWVSSPPHVMLLLPAELDQSVFSTNHNSGEPYIMWRAPPASHIMMPVAFGQDGQYGGGHLDECPADQPSLLNTSNAAARN